VWSGLARALARSGGTALAVLAGEKPHGDPVADEDCELERPPHQAQQAQDAWQPRPSPRESPSPTGAEPAGERRNGPSELADLPGRLLTGPAAGAHDRRRAVALILLPLVLASSSVWVFSHWAPDRSADDSVSGLRGLLVASGGLAIPLAGLLAWIVWL
jgi:hypothetical protein